MYGVFWLHFAHLCKTNESPFAFWNAIRFKMAIIKGDGAPVKILSTIMGLPASRGIFEI
jgi:hypothetical protein